MIWRKICGFQTIPIELYKQLKKQTKKEHVRLAISSFRVAVVAKTDDQIYVFSTAKIYTYFSFVFTTMPKKVELLKILTVM